MKNIICLLSLSFLIFGCNKGASDVEKDYIKNLEEKNRMLEEELQNIESESENNSESETSEVPEKRNSKKASRDYFTIGSTEDEVLDVMGDPTSLTSIGQTRKMYYYKYSTVSFQNGKVESYSNEGNLKVKVRD